jgi:HAD superfamily phosphoserine phosphatase-like hydrolase
VKVAVLDVDGTLYPGALGVQLLRTLSRSAACDRGKIDEVFAILDRYRLGQIDHDTMATLAYEAYARVITGVPEGELERCAKQTWEEEKGNLFPFVGELVALLKRKEFTIVIISGSPEEMIRQVAAGLGVSEWYGALFTADGGVYTGKVDRRPGALGAKTKILTDFLAQRSFDAAESFAIGDSMADLTLFQALGKPLAFEPKADLLALARDNRWTVASRHDIMERVAGLLGP